MSSAPISSATTAATMPVTTPAQNARREPGEQLMQFATGYMMSSALFAVTSLKIPDLLKSGSKTICELAASTGSHEDALYRVMRALSSVGLFNEIPARTFSLTPVSEPLCVDAASSMRDMALWLTCPFHFKCGANWGMLSAPEKLFPKKSLVSPASTILRQTKRSTTDSITR